MIKHNNPNPNGYNFESSNDPHKYFGIQSCASCRWVNYNGLVCGDPVSPKYNQKITEKTYCRYWTPKLQNPSFNKGI